MGRKNIDQMVSDCTPRFWQNFGGPNVEPAVHLDGVTTKDLAVQSFGQSQAELTLSGACGPNYNNQR